MRGRGPSHEISVISADLGIPEKKNFSAQNFETLFPIS